MDVKKVLDAKKRDVVTISPEATLNDAMEALINKKIGSLPVTSKDGALIGIVSYKDIFRAIFDDNSGFGDLTVKDLMTTDLVVGLVNDDINYIAGLMMNKKVRHIPILDDKKIVGLVSIGDVVAAQMKHMEIEVRYLRMYMEGTQPQ